MPMRRGILFSAAVALMCSFLSGGTLALASPGRTQASVKSVSREIEGSYLTKITNTGSGIRLTWSECKGAIGYHVLRGIREKKGWEKIHYLSGGASRSYTDTAVSEGKEYRYSIMALYREGDKVVEAPFDETGVYLFRLKAPRLTVSEKGGKAILRWKQVDGADGYVLMKESLDLGKGRVIREVNGGSKVEFQDGGIKPGKTYLYHIRAVRNGTDAKGNETVSYSAFARKSFMAGEAQQPGQNEQDGSSSQEGNSATVVEPSLPASGSEEEVTYRALLVGESAYNPLTFSLLFSTADRSDNLYGPYYDVRVMQTMLRNMHYSKVTVKENVNKRAILDAIGNAFTGADTDDVSLFYYFGHGSVVKDDTYSGALCPVGSRTEKDYITMKELAETLRKVQGKVVVMLDSCGSGAAILDHTGQEDQDSSYQSLFDPNYFARSAAEEFSKDKVYTHRRRKGKSAFSKYMELAVENKFYVMTASTVWQSSMDLYIDGTWGSAFCRGLAGGAGYTHASNAYGGSMPADTDHDNRITLKEAYTYTRKKALELDRSVRLDCVQYVQCFPENSALVIFRK